MIRGISRSYCPEIFHKPEVESSLSGLDFWLSLYDGNPNFNPTTERNTAMNRQSKIGSMLIMFTLVIFLGPLAGYQPATHAQTSPPVLLYVSTSGSDSSGNGSLGNPYATISHAVSVAPPHAIVIVQPGVYSEMVNITKTLTIESASSSPSDTVINAFGQVFGVEVIGSAASGTVIQGFTVEHANNHGIFVQNANDVTIEHNDVVSNGLNASSAIQENKGIELSGTSFSTVVNNYVANNMADGGIGVSDEGQINPGGMSPGIPAPAVGNVVAGNVIVGNTVGCGIVVAAYDPGEGVMNNIVSGNYIFNGLPGGIVVAADVPHTVAVNNTVIYNTVLNNLIPGIIVHSNTPGDVVTGTRILDNVVGGNGGFGPKPTGIILIGNIAGQTVVNDTLISGNVLHNEYFGILVANSTNSQILADNSFDSTVTAPVVGATVSTLSLSSLGAEVSGIQSSIAGLNSALSGNVSSLQNSFTSLNTQYNTLNGQLSNLQSTAASKTDLNNLSGQLGTVSDISYAALGVALVLGILAIALSLRKK